MPTVLLLSVAKEERKGRGHWPCKSFLTTTSFHLKSSWPFSCCAQMLVLLHSALVKQHRFWITSLLVFHFKYLFSRPQSSVQHLYSRSCGKYGKGFQQSSACVAQAASLLAYLPSFSSVSLHFLLPFPLLALTDYNLNLLPGRDSLGNNTKSLCGKLCDFTTNFQSFSSLFQQLVKGWRVRCNRQEVRRLAGWLESLKCWVTGTNHHILLCFWLLKSFSLVHVPL